MKFSALRLLVFGAFVLFPLFSRSSGGGGAIPSTDPDFSIVVFPDTQYYHGSYAYVLQDQANWVASHQASLNIKAVIGMGDIVDGGGYPVDSAGNVVGGCTSTPPSGWQTQWQQSQSAVSTLNSHGIYYQPTIGNHDYDC